MNTNIRVDKVLARKQWDAFVATLRALGDTLEFIEPDPRCPDMTFSGDGGLVYGNTFVPSNFHVAERSLEVGHYIRWFRERGYRIRDIDPGIPFEGLGDVVFHETTAIFGHGIRSDLRSIDIVQSVIPDLRIVARMRIVDDRFFHLAMALAFLNPETVLYYPPAFDAASIHALKAAIPDAIAASDEDAMQYFACNNLVIGNTVLLDNCTPSLRSTLRERGFDVITCDMSEFKKSGGSLRCLVLSFIEDTR